MDARHFLGIEPTSDPLHWRLPVTGAISTPGRFLFGGCGLAAGIVALEAAATHPTIWASAQYLAHAPTGSELDWHVTLAATGRRTTQARAVAHLGTREILTVNAALGHQPAPEIDDESWVTSPQVPPPQECQSRGDFPFPEETVFHRVEQRLATGRSPFDLDGTRGPARSSSWFRVPGHLEPSAATLAVLGDYVTGGLSQALGVHTMSRSLDNTIRVVRLVPTEWVLSDIVVYATAGGFAHGRAHLFAEDGTFLATASQSMSVRRWSTEQFEAMRAATPAPPAPPEG